MRKCTTPHTPVDRRTIPRVVLGLMILASTAAFAPATGRMSQPSPAGSAGTEPRTAQQVHQPAPNHAWVIFGKDTVVAEVARTEAEREKGLMDRQEVPDGTGMLFVFDDMQVRSFWMQNTYVALDIAFLDTSYGVVSIDHMAPLTTEAHDSDGPAMFALEVPQGWFAAHGVKRGDRAKVVYGIQLVKSGG